MLLLNKVKVMDLYIINQYAVFWMSFIQYANLWMPVIQYAISGVLMLKVASISFHSFILNFLHNLVFFETCIFI